MVAAALGWACAATDSGSIPEGEGLRVINGVDLFVKVMGTGSPLIVLHGGPGMDHSYLLPGLEALAENRQLIFYDQRATGRSVMEADSSTVTMDAFLADIDGMRAAFDLDRIDLIGHSWGGYLAMAYAIHNPAAVRKLVLMSTIEPGTEYSTEASRTQLGRRTAADSAELAALAASPESLMTPAGLARYFEVAFRSTFHDQSKADQVDITFFDNTVVNVPRIGALLFTASGGPADLWSELPGIGAHTLIVHGAADPTPLAMAQRLEDVIPRARLVVLERAGHFPYIEAPEELAAAIEEFLSEIDP
jgi:proline iminopeptidase